MTTSHDASDSLAAATGAVDAALPGLIRLALAHYTELACQAPAAQAKDRAAQQQAAKTALAHLEQLLKLARATDAAAPDGSGAGDPAPAAGEPADPAGMLRSARAAVHRLRG